MGFNPRNVPWMTIMGVSGLGVGYFIGKSIKADPMIPAFWGLIVGTGMALILRTLLTWKWARKMNENKDSEQDG